MCVRAGSYIPSVSGGRLLSIKAAADKTTFHIRRIDEANRQDKRPERRLCPGNESDSACSAASTPQATWLEMWAGTLLRDRRWIGAVRNGCICMG